MKNIKEFEESVMLDLPEAESAWMTDTADKLLSSFDELATVDTGGVPPLLTVLDVHNVFREDISINCITRDELLSNAPEPYNGYFRAPRTLS